MTTPNQYKKIFCAYHRTEFLTNFCVQKQCLMPLCPSCVGEHTQYHNKATNKAAYINLQQAMQDAKQKCYSFIVNMEDNQRKNDDIIKHINDIQQYIHQQLLTAKQQIYSYIDKIFRDYQHEVLNNIYKKYQENKIYNPTQAESIKNGINSTIDALYDKIGMLKGEQCLAGLITYYGEDQQSYIETFQVLEEYFNRHKKGKFNVTLNQKQLVTILNGLCEKVLIATIGNELTSSRSNHQNQPFGLKKNHSNYIKQPQRLAKNLQSHGVQKISTVSFNKKGSRVNQTLNY